MTQMTQTQSPTLQTPNSHSQAGAAANTTTCRSDSQVHTDRRSDPDGDLITVGSPVDRSADAIVLCPFTVAIDTREQQPFSFRGIKADADQAGKTFIIPTVRTTLRSGDYSIVGYEEAISIERKSHEDLYQTLTRDHQRFVRELERLTTYAYSEVVIEASWGKLLSPPANSRIAPKAISRAIQSLKLQFPSTQWTMAPDRRFAERYTFQILRKFWEHRQREKRAAEKAARATVKKAI